MHWPISPVVLPGIIYLFSLPLLCPAVDPIQVSVPSNPASGNAVRPNFLGISLELSFLDEYFGKDTSSIPPAVINYMKTLRARTVNDPLRFRVGGNSMDSSTYVPSQQSPMLQLTNPAANANNQPVDYGPMLWEVLNKVAQDVGGAQYLIGLSLLDPNSTNVPLLAGAAEQGLKDNLDAFLLGNEPDLYTNHQNRPNLVNYTVNDYINEFTTVSGHLKNTTAGNILDLHNLGGPTICCNWDLATLLQQGYLSTFASDLKYITLQHYPQNNCINGKYPFELPWYLQHANTVNLAAWQKHGISIALENTQGNRPKLLMSEFNSASCGGIPGISDTFAVGAIWTVDYALQLASMGYIAAYLHTRERGITYNIFAPPGSSDGSGNWTTNPAFYSFLVTAEALASENGSIVADLNLNNSTVNKNATAGGYAIYDAVNASVSRIVLFNYANMSGSETTTFSISASSFSKASALDKLTVRFLSAASASEKWDISWGGQTFAQSGDGNLNAAPADSPWAMVDQQLDCTSGCMVDVPGPGIAVVMVTPSSVRTISSSKNKNDAQKLKAGAYLTIGFIGLALTLV